jgi:iron(III) transport system substrate-binding protein
MRRLVAPTPAQDNACTNGDKMTRVARLAVLTAALTLAAFHVAVPAQPQAEAETLAAARHEGTVVVYATTDAEVARPLIRDFEALYPGIKVDYREIESLQLHQQFLRETAQGAPSADVLWSSAMDLQVKLVNDGHALHYRSSEINAVPAWSVWREEAYGTTFEPVGVAYNKRLLPDSEVPHTHGELARLLEAPGGRLKDKVTGYDLASAGLGFLVATQDSRASPLFWDVARGLGRNGARLRDSTAAMLDSVASGQSALAYNVLGSYARQRMRAEPAIGLVYLRDYTLVVSRIAFISRHAAHPNAARVWLDHVLSRRGQSVLAEQSGLASMRADVGGDDTAAALARTVGSSLKPIAIQPSLMAYLDRSKRADFLREWDRALAPTRP